MKLFLMSFIGTLLLGCAPFSTDINAVPDTGEANSSAVVVAQNGSLVIEKSEVDLLEISLPTEVNGMVLDGILTVPPEGSSFPSVILVHGSGPNDKDASIFGNKPFRDCPWVSVSGGCFIPLR